MDVLVGQAPNLTAADMDLISGLSNLGTLPLPRLFGVQLYKSHTDIAIQNSFDEDIDFTPTTTVVIGVNKITNLSSGESKGTNSFLTF
jgi:hypothetical protein